MSNRTFWKRAKRLAARATGLYVPPFVKHAQQLELDIAKSAPTLPAPALGDPGMLAIRQRARAVLPNQEVVGVLKRAMPAATAAPQVAVEIDERELREQITAALNDGRTQVTVAEFQRLLALPYYPRGDK